VLEHAPQDEITPLFLCLRLMKASRIAYGKLQSPYIKHQFSDFKINAKSKPKQNKI